MTIYRTLALVSLVALAGCYQLSSEDRAQLDETRTMAQDAKSEATQAAASAAESAEAAKAASQKADRIFRQSGVK